ncbi:MAG: hypothetical protein COB22_04045 [Cycloclasticus sp.]|nr:MAG: hypothetical protein COB22_04045 [Cycloclasticus sp.]
METSEQAHKDIVFFTPERQEKLDLISETIRRTKSPILLRGEIGLGKSFIIKQFIAQASNSWIVCQITPANLSQGNVLLRVLGEALNDIENNERLVLDRIAIYTRDEKKVIICVADASEMERSHFDFLFQMAQCYQCIHIILTSTSNLAENVESQCQLIDIKPFTLKQTIEFAKARINTTNLGFSNLASIDDVVLYIATKGIPGKINKFLSKLAEVDEIQANTKNRKSLSFPVWTVSIAILVVLVAILSMPPDSAKEDIIIGSKEIAPSAMGVKTVEEKPITTFVSKKDIFNKEAIDKASKRYAVAGERNLHSKDAIQAGTNHSLRKELTVLQKNHEWVSQREPRHYTLQLLGVSTEKAAKAYVSSHKSVEGLYFIQNKRVNGVWFTLIYGDFLTRSHAIGAIEKLSPMINGGDAWVRSFKVIQNEMLNANIALPANLKN